MNLVNVLEAYYDWRADFSKFQGSSLSPQRPYDCAIDLRLGGAFSLFLALRGRP